MSGSVANMFINFLIILLDDCVCGYYSLWVIQYNRLIIKSKLSMFSYNSTLLVMWRCINSIRIVSVHVVIYCLFFIFYFFPSNY